MVTNTFNFGLDIKNLVIQNTYAEFISGDTGVYIFNIRVYDNGSFVNLSSVARVSLTFLKKDTSVVVGNATIVDATSGLIQYILGTQEIACPGMVYVTLEIYGNNGERLTTPQFTFNVRKGVDHQNAVASSTEYPILTQLIHDVQDSIDKVGDTVDGSADNGYIIVNDNPVLVYQHPSSHPATIITQDTTHRFVTDAQIQAWDDSIHSHLNKSLLDDLSDVDGVLYYKGAPLQSGTGGGGEVGTVPSPPTSLTSTGVSSTSVALFWIPPSGTITNYLVEYKKASDTSWSTFSHSASNNNSITITGLTESTSYNFRVSAINSNGSSAPCTAYTISTQSSQSQAVPNQVTDVLISNIVRDSVSLSWSTPLGTITDYAIQYKKTSDSTWSTFSDGVSTQTSVVVTGLSSGTSYDFRVAAVNSSGTGPYSTVATATTSSIPAPSPVTGLTSISASASAVTLEWNAVSGIITDYVPEYKKSTDSVWNTYVDGVNVFTAVTIPGLDPNTSYDFRVAARNDGGMGSYSNILTKSTAPNVPLADYVRITTTGSTFAPKLELASGSTSTVTWEVEGTSDTYSGVTPTMSFGTSATRYIRLKVTNGGVNALGDIVTFNLGFSNIEDSGKYSLPASYNYETRQQVSALENVNSMIGLIRFLAATPSLSGIIDFTNMEDLQYIECYGAQLTTVVLTGCTSLIRLCLEDNSVNYLDLNPMVTTLRDLRGSGNSSVVILEPLKSPLQHLYHYCMQGERVVNHPTGDQLPAVDQLWDYNSGQSGPLVVRSSAITDVSCYGNRYTSIDVANQFPSSRDNSILSCSFNLITSVDITNCPGLKFIDFSNNYLDATAIDGILAEINSWGTSNGALDLSVNAGPSSTTVVNTLRGRGWTVTIENVGTVARSLPPAVTIGDELWVDNFDRANATGIVAVGNGWHGTMDCNIVDSNLVIIGSGYNTFLNPAGNNLPADCVVQTTIPPGTKGQFFGIIGRWKNGNGVRLLFTTDTNITVGDANGYDNKNITLSQNLPKVWTDIALPHTIAMRMVGTTIDVIIDGYIAATCTCATNATVTGGEIGLCGEGNNRVRYNIGAYQP